MHRMGTLDPRPACQCDRLMPKANPEQRMTALDAARGKLDGNSCVFGRAGARRNENGIPADCYRLIQADSVVSLDFNLRAQRQEVVDQHEGEAVDIVENQDSRVVHGRRMAGGLASGSGDPLLRRRDGLLVALDALFGLHRGKQLRPQLV